MDSSVDDCLCLSPPDLRNLFNLSYVWLWHDGLPKFEPPRAALPSQVFANIVKDLETVESVLDDDGDNDYMNERSLHILTLVNLE